MAAKKETNNESIPPIRLAKENYLLVQVLAKQARRSLRNQLDLIVEQWKKDHPEDWKDLLD